jgi:hypothetical protein
MDRERKGRASNNKASEALIKWAKISMAHGSRLYRLEWKFIVWKSGKIFAFLSLLAPPHSLCIIAEPKNTAERESEWDGKTPWLSVEFCWLNDADKIPVDEIFALP